MTRTLLFLAAGLAAAPPFMIFVLSGEPLGALPITSLFFLTAAAFFTAAREIGRNVRRAKLLAVAGALGMASLGTLAGWSLGLFTFPAAAMCVIAAWAALLHRSGSRTRVALGIYVAIGLLVALSSVGASGLLWSLGGVLIWPIWLLVMPGLSILPLWLAQVVAAILAIAAFVSSNAIARPLGARGLAVAAVAGLVLGAIAVAAFVVLANARVDTSARFELAPLVLGPVFAGGLLLGAGIVTARLRPSILSAVGAGLGASLLFVVFSASPAVRCYANGTSQGTPLEWELASFGRSSGSSGSSGSTSSGAIQGDRPTRTTGQLNTRGRTATYVCEGARVVEFREIR